jgi:hypothetical protein
MIATPTIAQEINATGLVRRIVFQDTLDRIPTFGWKRSGAAHCCDF